MALRFERDVGSREGGMKKHLLTLLCVVVIAHPAEASSGFVSRKGKLSKGFTVDNPSEKIILIYNHGSNAEFEKDPCEPEEIDYIWLGGTPSILANLSGEKILGKTILVYAFCSSELRGDYARLSWTLPAPYPGASKQEKRQKAILEIVEKFLALGVPAKQIFLAGYSAGGWASLTIAATDSDKVNAAIAFGPAVAAKWWPRDKGWRALRASLVERIKSADNLKALVFAHPNDPYETPESLAFLREFSGVEFIELPRYPKKIGKKWCRYADNPEVLIRDGHDIYQASCFHTYAPRIVDYIQRRLKAVGD